jgi:hypothetical protein
MAMPRTAIRTAIGRKHGNTLIPYAAKNPWPALCEGLLEDEKLTDVLHKMDEPSLRALIQDYEAGKLEQICGRAA